jgi:hypothetical protein
VYELSQNKMVKIGIWKEKNLFLVNIREFYNSNMGKHGSGQKGLALTRDQWRKFYENIQDMNDDVESFDEYGATGND